AETEDAARPVIENHRRPLLLVDVQLGFSEAAFARAVAEHHVLEFALAALIADRTIERVIAEQKFQSGFAGFANLFGVGLNHHALPDRQRTRHLHLGHLFHFHQTHAAGGLQRIAFVIAERRDFDTVALGGFDHQRSRRRFEFTAVDCEFHQISHYAATSFFSYG